MNIVLPLGNGSKHDDTELRFCLRSIEQHLTGWDKIIIVGRWPAWVVPDPALVLIEMAEMPNGKEKEANIARKIKAAINSGLAGSDFLFMNDDHFLLQDQEAAAFPYHYKEPLQASHKRLGHYSVYRRTLYNTLKAFPAAMNYDTHCPIVYNAETFMRVIPAKFPPYGYAIKTMYCTGAGILGSLYPDLKITWQQDDRTPYSEWVCDRPYFSIGDGACNDDMWGLLRSLYPNPSRLECL